MLIHLHLHLEPGERNSGLRMQAGRRYSSRDQFFAAHSLSFRRPRVSIDRYSQFLEDLHAEQRGQNVTYVELRLSPRRLLLDGTSWDEFLRVSEAFLCKTINPVVRGVLLLNRDSPEQFLDEVHGVLTAGLPPSFVGIDLAGDEIGYSDVSKFVPIFSKARATGLGVTVHAGEFGEAKSVWRAIDELGAVRIGHGLAARKDATLMSRLAREEILIEISITSNVALGAIPSISEHPAREFHERGIPISFNSDVPLHTGCSLADELLSATALLGEAAAREAQISAAKYSFAPII